MGGCNKKNILSKIGQASMILYVTHYIILVVSENALTIILKNNNPYFMFVLNSTILIITLTLIYFLFKNKKYKSYVSNFKKEQNCLLTSQTNPSNMKKSDR